MEVECLFSIENHRVAIELIQMELLDFIYCLHLKRFWLLPKCTQLSVVLSELHVLFQKALTLQFMERHMDLKLLFSSAWKWPIISRCSLDFLICLNLWQGILLHPEIHHRALLLEFMEMIITCSSVHLWVGNWRFRQFLINFQQLRRQNIKQPLLIDIYLGRSGRLLSQMHLFGRKFQL